jgi:uncharacterized membrane protein
MTDFRIERHPILPRPDRPTFTFRWDGRELVARQGETIASALFANGIRVFGHHAKDGAPQGIYCANGQCAQCSVVADGLSVKSCMVPVRPGMQIGPLERASAPPVVATAPRFLPVETIEIECLILGGGPAGLSAAIELGRAGVGVILVDDKSSLGGKLVLQTHKFFGSIDACYAGTRGIDIAAKLEQAVRGFENVRVWTDSMALAVFSDRKVGVLRTGYYSIVGPQVLLVATGAREKSLVFRGNTLPGVYGAGAFQTLVNRDMVRPTARLFVIGGGNVGLIAGYHALQAGIQVVGLCEAMADCGGYKVHKDKLARLGVPIYTSHTVISANGKEEVESVTVAELDPCWKPVAGTQKTFSCDTVNKSQYAELAGIPVALVGLGGYALLALLSWLNLRGKDFVKDIVVFSVLGFLFSLYLTYIEAYVLFTWCPVCLASQAVILAIVVLSVVGLQRHQFKI